MERHICSHSMSSQSPRKTSNKASYKEPPWISWRINIINFSLICRSVLVIIAIGIFICVYYIRAMHHMFYVHFHLRGRRHDLGPFYRWVNRGFTFTHWTGFYGRTTMLQDRHWIHGDESSRQREILGSSGLLGFSWPSHEADESEHRPLVGLGSLQYTSARMKANRC